MRRESLIPPIKSEGWTLVVYPNAVHKEGSEADLKSAGNGHREVRSSKTGDVDTAVVIGDGGSRKAKRRWLTRVVKKLYDTTQPGEL
eukprot:650823-Karenia_brevis.AAC.1